MLMKEHSNYEGIADISYKHIDNYNSLMKIVWDNKKLVEKFLHTPIDENNEIPTYEEMTASLDLISNNLNEITDLSKNISLDDLIVIASTADAENINSSKYRARLTEAKKIHAQNIKHNISCTPELDYPHLTQMFDKWDAVIENSNDYEKILILTKIDLGTRTVHCAEGIYSVFGELMELLENYQIFDFDKDC